MLVRPTAGRAVFVFEKRGLSQRKQQRAPAKKARSEDPEEVKEPPAKKAKGADFANNNFYCGCPDAEVMYGINAEEAHPRESSQEAA